MNVDDILERVRAERASAIIRTDNQAVAAGAMEAAVRAGFKVVEFTLGCPGAYELIEEFSSRPDLLVGVGTVLEPEQAERAVQAGARFIVSPVTDERVIAAALDLDVVAMPGTFTASEMERAWRAGAQLQKLFPAPANGPEYVKMIRGPLPFLRIVPTSGVTADNVGDWIAAGAWSVGFVASLFVQEDLQARRFDAIEARARLCLEAARAATGPAIATVAASED